MKMKCQKHQHKCGGFSLIEVMIILVIIAILLVFSFSSLLNILPNHRMRAEANTAENIVQQARIKAASTQKPTRVILDCSEKICFLRTQIAIYDKGVVNGWQDANESLHVLHPTVKIAKNPTGKGIPDGKDTPENIYWLIMMPGGKVFSNPRPFDLFFYNTQLAGSPRPGWQLKVNNDSGRTSIIKAEATLGQ